MSTPTFTSDSVVRLHQLHIGDEVDDAVEVGRPDTGVFVSLPVEGATVVRWLVEQVPLTDIAEQFVRTYGVELDVVDFVRDLSGCGFVRSIDGRDLGDDTTTDNPAEPAGWRLFAELPQAKVRWLLSGPAYACYAAIWLADGVLLASRSDLRPSADRAYLDIGVLGNLVLLTLVGWLLMLLHEMAHLLAVRARGCSGSLDISHRLYLLVAQTDISSVRTLPRRQRYAPYLAGVTWDATVLLCCLLLQLAGLPSGVPRAISYLLVMTMILELALFLRTDVYYVMTNFLRLGNLMSDTRRWLANQARRSIGARPAHDLSDIPARELRVIRWYAVLVVAGVGVVIAQFVVLGLPLLVRFLRNAASGLDAGPASVDFWQSVALYAVVIAQFGVLFLAMVRERRRVSARSAAAASGRALVDS